MPLVASILGLMLLHEPLPRGREILSAVDADGVLDRATPCATRNLEPWYTCVKKVQSRDIVTIWEP